ncbi:MAG: hypothetical protein KDJ73_11460 [Notoacmeibacter sp.]|nr:hypothetical protein [Notoacmeibacter sp.]MCC0032900.1 hypothetical protein [Brucellaceae bacterium]
MATLPPFEMPDPRWPVPASVLDGLWLDSDMADTRTRWRFSGRTWQVSGAVPRHHPSAGTPEMAQDGGLGEGAEDRFPASGPVPAPRMSAGAPGAICKRH